jgi:23S rRNA (cytosine1962-C5)-methyltransferase
MNPKTIQARSPRLASGYRPETIQRHAEMLGNRVRKVHKHLHKAFVRQQIGAYRLYDRDIPEIRAVVDWYEGHVVVGEYVRLQTLGTGWLEAMGAAVAQALEIPSSRVHLRQRHTRPKEGERYARLGEARERLVVSEGDVRFWVDLDSFLDTGLFADHRLTRARVRSESRGKRILNLFAYTGSFTVYAAAGGAKATTTVDLSKRYLAWASYNLSLNKLDGPEHRLVAAEARSFLRDASRRGDKWDLIILDPPSFSTREGLIDFDIQRDHPELLRETLAVLAPGGQLYFSTNHQRFQAEFSGLPVKKIDDLTASTTPIDYRGHTPHFAYLLS